MFLHYFTLKRQIQFLRDELLGGTIRSSFTQMKNEQILEVETGSGKLWHLLLSAHPAYPTMLLREPGRRARNSTDVLPELIGQRIASLELLPYERVAVFRFAEKDIELYVQLFRNHANFFLLNSQGVILNAFKKARKYIGNTYQLKSGNFLDVRKLASSEFVRLLQEEAEAPLEYVLKRRFYFLSTEVVAELSFRVEKNFRQEVSRFSGEELSQLFRTIREFLEECEQEAPRIYYQDGFPHLLALTEFRSLTGMPRETYATVNEALGRFVFQRLRQENLFAKRENLRKHLQRKLEQLRALITRLENLPDEQEVQEHYKRIGELILSQMQRISPGAEKVKLIDYYHPQQQEVEVALNPALSAAENAQVYFRKAREVRQRREELRERLQYLRKQLQELEQLQAELDGEVGFKQLRQIEKKLTSMHIIQTAGEKLAEVHRPYRQYFYHNWEIWVGKNARANDEMTFRHAHKEDLWLHAQGVSGSHVVVRNPQRKEHIPREVVEYAARLAARNSQARHSSYVPVMVTRVKYVRKPRGSAPGAVLPERTKTVFVEPERK